jgi:large subunit ribosomal protein L18
MGIKITNKNKLSNFKKTRRIARVRAVVRGVASRPRLAVYRTLKHMSAQIINDDNGKTLVAAHDYELKEKLKGKVAVAAAVGKMIAEKAKKAGIVAVVFDRRAHRYHGRVKALADAAREGGLKF